MSANNDVLLHSLSTVPPSSPVFTDVTTTTTTSRILWTHPTTTPPTDFVLTYRVSWSYVGPCTGPGAPTDVMRVLDGSTRTFSLTNLVASSQYSVRLEARNDAGTSISQTIVNTPYAGKYLSSLYLNIN